MSLSPVCVSNKQNFTRRSHLLEVLSNIEAEVLMPICVGLWQTELTWESAFYSLIHWKSEENRAGENKTKLKTMTERLILIFLLMCLFYRAGD